MQANTVTAPDVRTHEAIAALDLAIEKLGLISSGMVNRFETGSRKGYRLLWMNFFSGERFEILREVTHDEETTVVAPILAEVKRRREAKAA